ncbi:MAG: TlpA family protein disulfide reductase, partial [Odoribacter sp.]|nr:TlpA family protein disulfide reductase [Odoribacter sp.]
PDFVGNTPDGQSLSLYDVKGKVKLLNFWGSWCGNCRKESLKLKKLYEEFHDKGLEVIGFSVDQSKEKWLAALEQAQYPWIQLIDTENQGKASELYVITAVPNTYLLDENNNIIGRNLQDEVLRAELEKRLEK